MASQQGNAGTTAVPPTAPAGANANGSRITFVIPPPVTFFLQFNDGMQMAITPNPTPIVMGLPGVAHDVGVMMPGLMSQLFTAAGAGAGGANTQDILNALFMQAQQQSHGPPPTSPAFLEKLPVKIWSDKVKACERQDECPICLSDFETKDQVISLPCGHLYHKACGLQWLGEHNVCPTCRYKLPTQQDEAPAAAAPATAPAAPQPAASSNQASEQQQPQRASRTRPRSPVMMPIRVVRRRVGEVNEPSPEPSPATTSSSIDDDALDLMMDQEADRMIAEERQQAQTSTTDMDVDSSMDQDAEALLHSNSN